ncbi:DUF368 domain-containing protein [Pontibacillus sp. HMF3514]|uniref:DUF368 domain-containing protein n=1 Tax=Pontibacillus sp. HMF3514 TaxID=2692425 RepID=UPI00132026E6|nr:DUF368 domain-containing protein [Pontibacillus sp. HMF3514]QHE50787.1 DUF368 domain-containing protein [Pontibacillus sp. HMF3514]
MEWKNIYRGMLMGTSDLVPGVSGGTIAVILGIYDRLIEAVNGVFSREWKKHIGFFIPLIIGIGAAILLLSQGIHWLLNHYKTPTLFFFLGLIIGVIPFLFKQAGYKENFKGHHYGYMVVSGALVASLAVFNQGDPEAWGSSLSTLQMVLLFLSGWLASMAMILPGISGSLLLLLVGVYPTVIQAVKELQIGRVFVFGLGVLVGLMITSKAIQWVFNKYPSHTYAIIIGLVFGSIIVLYPGIPSLMLLSFIAFVGGLFAAYLLGQVEHT